MGRRGEEGGHEGESKELRRKARQKGAVRKAPRSLTFLSSSNRKTNSVLRGFCVFLSTEVVNEM